MRFNYRPSRSNLGDGLTNLSIWKHSCHTAQAYAQQCGWLLLLVLFIIRVWHVRSVCTTRRGEGRESRKMKFRRNTLSDVLAVPAAY